MKTQTLHLDLTRNSKNPHALPMLVRRWQLSTSARQVFDLLALSLVGLWTESTYVSE